MPIESYTILSKSYTILIKSYTIMVQSYTVLVQSNTIIVQSYILQLGLGTSRVQVTVQADMNIQGSQENV